VAGHQSEMNRIVLIFALAVAMSQASAWGEDPGARELQRNLQQRQQQQEELQLRMQQYQRSAPPPSGVQQNQAIRQLEIEQLQRQRALHYRQQQNLPLPDPMDDEATRRAKAQLEQQRANEESRRQMQRFDWELEQARRQGSGN